MKLESSVERTMGSSSFAPPSPSPRGDPSFGSCSIPPRSTRRSLWAPQRLRISHEHALRPTVIRSAIGAEHGYLVNLTQVTVFGLVFRNVEANVADLGYGVDGLLGIAYDARMGIRSWWDKLRGAGTGAVEEARDSHAAAERVATTRPSERLAIHECLHAGRVGGRVVAMRTFITEGLAAWNAREVRVTVRADSDGDAGAAVNVLALQERLATANQPSRHGGFSAFRTPAGEVINVTYARGEPIAGIPGAAAALVAVRLHPDEMTLVQRGMGTRVLGRLAAHARVFPYPACWEHRAKPVLTLAEQESSVLVNVGPMIAPPDVHATVHEGETATLVLSLPASVSADLHGVLGERSEARMLVLLTKLAPEADSQLVWVPGSHERNVATAVAAPRRTGCAFVLFTAATPAAFKQIEDGVGIVLPDEAFDRVHEALIGGRDLEVPIAEGCRLAIEFRRDDGAPVAVDIAQVVLLLPDEKLGAYVDASELAAFIKKVRGIVEHLADVHPVEQTLRASIGLTLLPGKPPRVELTADRREEPPLFPALRTAIAEMPWVEVGGEVPFRVDVIVRGTLA